MDSIAMKALLALLGIILLLPGACAIVLAYNVEFNSGLLIPYAICFVISGVGVATLYLTFRKPRQPPG